MNKQKRILTEKGSNLDHFIQSFKFIYAGEDHAVTLEKDGSVWASVYNPIDDQGTSDIKGMWNIKSR
jgi:hypothetical protein